VINAIMQSKDWDSTAIFLGWDDWGGYYDNVDPPKVDAEGYGIRVPGLVISPYAKQGYIDHQNLSFDAYLKFIEDDFLGGVRIDNSDGRPDSRPDVRENAPELGNLIDDFDFNQTPRKPIILDPNPFKGVNLLGPEKIGTTGTNPLTPYPECPRATGVVAGTRVAPVVLGRTRASERRSLTHYFPMANRRFDDLCVASGHGIRVGYLTRRPGGPQVAVLAMTENTLYSDDGFTPGQKLPSHGLPTAIRRGRFEWYAVRLAKATLFIKALNGLVQEVGLGSRGLTRTHAAQVRLLADLHA
jgi:hypothetical protein